MPRKTDNSKKVSIHELLLVNEERFRPNILKEYFQEDGIYYRNKFKPTKYMQLQGQPQRHPKTILDLLFHLSNYNSKKYEYLLNHLAYFFKYLKKSPVAIALIGKQGAGKGILFDLILSELFGREYCITINNENISSRYKGQIIKDKLYYNFDEVKLSTSKKNDSFIKAVIANPSISLEEKNVTMSKEVELFGQCIFSSNHIDALSIEESDRRFTVISTGDNLANSKFLHYGSYDKFIIGIKQDLEDFAKYLKNYTVNIDLAINALDTAEKRAIIKSQKNDIEEFHRAIIDIDYNYFYDLTQSDQPLYHEMMVDFKKDRINRVNIKKAYNALFLKKVSTNEIMKRLRGYEPYYIFSEENSFHNGNNHYYNLAR